MRVTNKPKAPHHSIYFGAPFSDPSSIKSKSKTRFRAAIITTTILNLILNGEALFMLITPRPEQKKLITKFIT